jgi:hypothetical protein
LGTGLGAVGERRDRLSAAELEDALYAAHERRVQNGGIRTAVRLGRGAENPRRAAREPSRHAEHQGRGGQRRVPGRHVQSDALDRARETLAAHASGRIDRERSGELRLVKSLDVRRGCANRRALHLAQLVARGSDFRLSDLERRELDAVELGP